MHIYHSLSSGTRCTVWKTPFWFWCLWWHATVLARRIAPALNLAPPGLKSSALISSKCLEISHQIQNYCKYNADTAQIFAQNFLIIIRFFFISHEDSSYHLEPAWRLRHLRHHFVFLINNAVYSNIPYLFISPNVYIELFNRPNICLQIWEDLPTRREKDTRKAVNELSFD